MLDLLTGVCDHRFYLKIKVLISLITLETLHIVGVSPFNKYISHPLTKSELLCLQLFRYMHRRVLDFYQDSLHEFIVEPINLCKL